MILLHKSVLAQRNQGSKKNTQWNQGRLKHQGSSREVWLCCIMWNKITLSFWFCSWKKEMYNKIIFSLYIFFSKKIINESVILLYTIHNRITILLFFLVLLYHDIVILLCNNNIKNNKIMILLCKNLQRNYNLVWPWRRKKKTWQHECWELRAKIEQKKKGKKMNLEKKRGREEWR